MEEKRCVVLTWWFATWQPYLIKLADIAQPQMVGRSISWGIGGLPNFFQLVKEGVFLYWNLPDTVLQNLLCSSLSLRVKQSTGCWHSAQWWQRQGHSGGIGWKREHQAGWNVFVRRNEKNSGWWSSDIGSGIYQCGYTGMHQSRRSWKMSWHGHWAGQLKDRWSEADMNGRL